VRDAAMTWTGRSIVTLPTQFAKDGVDFCTDRGLCANVSEADQHFIGRPAVTRPGNLGASVNPRRG
jgi:hypothetical protein